MVSLASVLPPSRWQVLIVLIVGCAFGASAEPSPSQGSDKGSASQSQAGTSYISGNVRNERGDGIGEIVVAAGDVTAVTRFNGDYTLGPIPAGEYTLKLSDPARRYVRLDNPRVAPKVSVAANASVKHIDATLQRERNAVGRISGRVHGVGSDSQALTFVDAFLIDSDNYYNVGTTAVKDGRYSMGGLPDGEYVVRASRYIFSSGEFQHAYFHDGESLEVASLVSLGVAEELSSIEVYLEGTAHAELGGKVLDHEGNPLASISVSLMSMDMLEWQTVSTDDEGRFKMQGIAPDKYRLRFKDPSGRYESTYLESKDFFASRAMELKDGENDAVTARLSSMGKLQGSIELAQGDAGRVVFFVDVYKAQAEGGYARVASEYLRKAGEFTVTGVPSGDVRVAVRAYNRGTRTSAVTFHRGVDSVEASPDVQVSPEEGAEDLQFYVSI